MLFPKRTHWSWPLAVGLFGLTFVSAQGDKIIDLGRGPVTVHEPPSYDPEVPTPVVLLLHGYTSSGSEIESYVQLTQLSDEFGFLYAFPDGTRDCFGLRFWNATDACCNFCQSDVDDSGYLRALIDEIKVQCNVDPRRVFLVGHSNGGFMSYRMACDHADAIAAVVSLSGATFLDPADCSPGGPVHTLEIHGTADGVIQYDGGCLPPGCYPGAVETTEQWASYDGCSLDPDTSHPPLDLDEGIPGDETLVTRYGDACVPGGSAELWTIVGGAHTPDLSEDFSRLVVGFLLSHPKPVDCEGVNNPDLIDFLIFQECFSGPGHPVAPQCACRDSDGDGDVDWADFAIFQQIFAALLR